METNAQLALPAASAKKEFTTTSFSYKMAPLATSFSFATRNLEPLLHFFPMYHLYYQVRR